MRKIKFLFTALVAMFAVTVVSAQTLNDVKAQYNEAAQKMQARDFAAAIPLFEKTIEMGFEVGADATDIVQQAQKNLPTCYLYTGLELCKSEKYEEAIPVLEQTVELGELYGDAKAVRNAKQLISQAFLAMGATAFNAQDYGKAIDIFSKGYAANPNDTNLGLYLAESYAENKDYDQGLEIYRNIAGMTHARHKEAADQAKEKIQYYLSMQASDVAKAGDTQKAYEMFQEILDLDPANASAHMMRIQTATNAEQWNNVIKWGQQAADAQTDPAMKSDAYFFLGAAYQNTENNAQAISAYRKVTDGNKVAAAKEQIGILNK